ncbi:NAD(P)H-binding protein [Nonomuraea sp. NPDC049607]|uniref:NAD(P)H-binding protein n=1 Tax=Nonomuraea sp. NPDC049607 TaxID=3154732 RepID=UPI0034353D08
MRHPYADMARMEQALSGTGLTWTAVRPTGLTDKPGDRLRRPTKRRARSRYG